MELKIHTLGKFREWLVSRSFSQEVRTLWLFHCTSNFFESDTVMSESEEKLIRRRISELKVQKLTFAVDYYDNAFDGIDGSSDPDRITPAMATLDVKQHCEVESM